MTAPASRRRGQPVVVLGAILLCWVAGRVVASHHLPPAAPLAMSDVPPATVPSSRQAPSPLPSQTRGADVARPVIALPPPSPPPPVRVEVGEGVAYPAQRPRAPARETAFAPTPAAVAGGHGLLWLAAVSRLPLPPAFMSPTGRAPAGAAWPARHEATPRGSRWTADGWLLLRGRGAPPGAAPFASYGASQIGAVVRYRLDPASRHRPMATLRAAAALDGSGEREVALGLAVRPVSAVPVSLIAELRATRLASGAIRARPAVSAVTELAPVALPLGLRGQAYGQAGYVGGAGATAFADGELRIDRSVALYGAADLRLGAAAWGGAQDGAARFDIGPTVSLGLSGSGKAARLGLDWRLRVAGNAAPASGPALTLSAGF